MEKTHADLNIHHYRTVRENPLYALEGMMDVERECQDMNTLPMPDFSDFEDRIGNLEAISAQPGKLPRQFHDSLQQMQGHINLIQNRLNEALDRGKKRAEERAKKQPKKSTYKGLSA